MFEGYGASFVLRKSEKGRGVSAEGNAGKTEGWMVLRTRPLHECTAAVAEQPRLLGTIISYTVACRKGVRNLECS